MRDPSGPASPRPDGAGRQRRSQLGWTAVALLVGPALLVYAAIFIWPQLMLLPKSFVGPGGTFTTANFERFLLDPFYLQALWRTLWLGVVVTATTLVLGYPFAYFISRLEQRWASILLLITLFPLLVSAVVRSFGWMVLFFRSGLISRGLRMLGVGEADFQLMYSFAGVVIALAAVLLPFMVFSIYAVIKSIEPDLEKAAMNLGASPLAAAILITFRLSLGGVLAGCLIVFSLAISTFATPALVGGPRYQVMATMIYEQSVELYDWNFASALSIILLATVLVVAIVYIWMIQKMQVEVAND